jgi:hypothetical protein
MMILAFPFFSALAARSMNLYGLFALAAPASYMAGCTLITLVGLT